MVTIHRNAPKPSGKQCTAIENALNKSAPDQDSWNAGWNAFVAAHASSASAEDCLYAALDASAPDETSWYNGMTAYYEASPSITVDEIRSDPGRHRTAAFILSAGEWLASKYASHVSGPHGQPRAQHTGRY